MLKTLSLARDHLRSKPSPSTIRVLSSPFSSKRHAPKASEEESSPPKESVLLYPKDPSSTPKLFLVQPRLTPPKFLQAKLNEALCLANSLEEQRYGYFESDFFDKELPSHVVVQNPIARSSKPRVGMSVSVSSRSFWLYCIKKYAFQVFDDFPVWDWWVKLFFQFVRYLFRAWDCRQHPMPS